MGAILLPVIVEWHAALGKSKLDSYNKSVKRLLSGRSVPDSTGVSYLAEYSRILKRDKRQREACASEISGH